MRATEATRDRAWGYPWLSRSGWNCMRTRPERARDDPSSSECHAPPNRNLVGSSASPALDRSCCHASARIAGIADRQDCTLDGIDRVAATALDLEIRRGDGLNPPANALGIPAVELPAGLVDLPWCHRESLGQLGGGAATCAADLHHLAQLHRQHSDDRHRAVTSRDGVAYESQRLPRI